LDISFKRDRCDAAKNKISLLNGWVTQLVGIGKIRQGGETFKVPGYNDSRLTASEHNHRPVPYSIIGFSHFKVRINANIKNMIILMSAYFLVRSFKAKNKPNLTHLLVRHKDKLLLV